MPPSPLGQHGHRLRRELGRHEVAAREFAVAHLVAGGAQARHQAAAARADGQHVVGNAMRHEDARPADGLGGAAKPGEKARTCVNRSPFLSASDKA